MFIDTLHMQLKKWSKEEWMSMSDSDWYHPETEPPNFNTGSGHERNMLILVISYVFVEANL